MFPWLSRTSEFILSRLLIAKQDKVEGVVEELSQRPEEVDTAPKLNRFVKQALLLHVLPEIFMSNAHCPVQVGEGNTLLGPSYPHGNVSFSNAGASFGRKPVHQVTIDLSNGVLLLFCGYVQRQSSAPFGSPDLLNDRSGHGIGVSFHMPN